MGNNATRQAENDDPGVEKQLARNGGLSYLEIPAVDVRASALFYGKVLGWSVELEGGAGKFRDRTGHLIGRWNTGRAISREGGFQPYFYVDNLADVMKQVCDHGGQIVKPPSPEGNLSIAIVRDPAGNPIGLWQQGPVK